MPERAAARFRSSARPGYEERVWGRCPAAADGRTRIRLSEIEFNPEVPKGAVQVEFNTVAVEDLAAPQPQPMEPTIAFAGTRVVAAGDVTGAGTRCHAGGGGWWFNLRELSTPVLSPAPTTKQLGRRAAASCPRPGVGCLIYGGLPVSRLAVVEYLGELFSRRGVAVGDQVRQVGSGPVLSGLVGN